ncbi:MAG TPA: hypothetical protein V6D17_20065 [Candidatus Obscuribacterales bacterium]
MKWVRRQTNTLKRQRVMRSMFQNKCTCGRPIAIGDLIYYDAATGLVRCYPCGQTIDKLAQEQLIEVVPITDAQRLIDELARLKVLPDSLEKREKLKTCFEQLVSEHSADQEFIVFIRRLLVRAQPALRTSTARKASFCHKCKQSMAEGAVIAWHPRTRAVICILCIQRMLGLPDSLA